MALENSKLETKLATLSDRPIPEAPVFRPTAAQFRDPLRYVASIRREAEPFGICKIVPPRGWKVECAVDWNSTKKFATKRQRSVRRVLVAFNVVAAVARRGRSRGGGVEGAASPRDRPPYNAGSTKWARASPSATAASTP